MSTVNEMVTIDPEHTAQWIEPGTEMETELKQQTDTYSCSDTDSYSETATDTERSI